MPTLMWDYEPESLQASVSELLIATADSSDALVDDSVREVLHEVREHLKLDVIFLSEIRDGQRMFKHVDARPGAEVIQTGGGGPLEASLCQCVLDGRLPQLVRDVAAQPNADQLPVLPFPVGAHLAVPVVLSDGRVYGTLCAFSLVGDDGVNEQDHRKLTAVARAAAQRIDLRRRIEGNAEMAAWASSPQHPGAPKPARDGPGRRM